MVSDDPVLPDLLTDGMTLVFCGTAPSRRSAAEHAYYAHPGNYFWPALAEVGLTPRRFSPDEFRELAPLGIGLTDLAKHASGNDAELPKDAFDAAALLAKLRRHRPALVAFTSKNAARAVLKRVDRWGEQDAPLATSRVFVLPSPSGQARGHWDITVWRDLAAAYRRLRG